MGDMTDDASFQVAADFVEQRIRLSDPAYQSDALKLQLYGLYKQALFGAVQDPQPSLFYPKQRAKWTAWKAVAELTQEEAQEQYIQLVKQCSPEWEGAEEGQQNGTGPVFSRMATEEAAESEEPSDSQRALFLLMELKMDVVQWKDALKEEGKEIGVVDGALRNALHWAADSGNLEAIAVLIEAGIDVNSPDNEQMTPLHYAALCGHHQVALQLERHGGRWDLPDASGETPSEMAPAEWGR